LRSYRNFSAGDTFAYDKRAGGPFEVLGLGANHFGAFIAYYCAAILGMSFFEENKKLKYLFFATVLLGLHPLFFSYSRGVYIAFFTIIVFFGLVKKRSLLLIAVLFVLLWQTLLPPSVVDRIMMTKTEEGQIESSAAHRLVLWDHAIGLFNENPVIGVGFGGFGYTVPEGELTDTHNFYIKTLCEQGIIGISLLLIIFVRAFTSGFKLFRKGTSAFQKGLGLGFTGAIACKIATFLATDGLTLR
jgi:O-antigen ligase